MTLKNAAGGYAGDGRASWGGVKKAEAIAPETPPADCKTELDEARQRIEVLTAALESARSLLTNANQEVGAAIADIDEAIGPVAQYQNEPIVSGVK